MGDLYLRIDVDGTGVLRASRYDTKQKGPASQVAGSGLDVDLVRLFEGWLQLRDRTWDEAEIRIFGSLLHRCLFGERGWDWIEGAIASVAPTRCRLELSFPADGAYARLASLPWEYLYRPDRPGATGGFLAARPDLVLVPVHPAVQRRRPARARDPVAAARRRQPAE